MDYSLTEQFELIGKAGQKKLMQSTVALIGLGGVGSTVAQILARSGVNLRIVDKDRTLEQDMPRQTLYVEDDINKFKAKQAKRRLEEINKKIKIKTFHEELSKENIFLLEADIIVDTSNDLKTALLVNDFAISKKIPLISVNYAGEKGNVFVVDRSQFKKGACLGCIHDKLTLGELKDKGVYPPITTMLASLAANAAIKNLLDIENVQSLLKVDVIKTEIRHSTVEKVRGCKHCKGK